jgi:hypothetical protein
MVHPSWIHRHTYHVQERMFAYMLQTRPFDAFELTSGQTLEENQLQVNLWEEERAKGHFVPVVGSSDSHGTVNSAWFNVSKMVVFAERNEKEALFEAIRSGRVTVLEQYQGEAMPRLYGQYRYMAFALFLLHEYFPLHDELCFEQGRAMRDYALGDTGVVPLLRLMEKRCTALMQKYWGA